MSTKFLKNKRYNTSKITQRCTPTKLKHESEKESQRVTKKKKDKEDDEKGVM